MYCQTDIISPDPKANLNESYRIGTNLNQWKVIIHQ